MADYEDDFRHFSEALGLASAAIVFIPYASPLLGLLYMLLADPHAQDQAADQWLNPNAVNVGPATGPSLTGAQQEWHPPMADQQGGTSDIANLRGELKRISNQIGENGDWEGQAYKSFKGKVEELDEHLAMLDRNRAGVGDTLRATAHGFHALVMFGILVAGFLVALATFVRLAMGWPPSVPGVTAMAMRSVHALHVSVRKAAGQHWKGMLKITAGLAAVGILYNQFSHDLPGLQAVSAKAPNLMDAGAVYDPSSIDIVDDPQSQFDTSKMENPSFMPDFGF